MSDKTEEAEMAELVNGGDPKALDLEAIKALFASIRAKPWADADGRQARETEDALIAEVERLSGLLTRAIIALDDTYDLAQVERAQDLLAESGLPLELP